MKQRKKRLIYTALFALLFLAEVLIALYVRDSFIRPYFGDVLVTLLLCVFVRIFIPDGVALLPLYVFVFAVGVEILQFFDFVSLIGLGDSAFFRTLLGTSFSYLDILCYCSGCLVFFGAECVMRRKSKRAKAIRATAPPKE